MATMSRDCERCGTPEPAETFEIPLTVGPSGMGTLIEVICLDCAKAPLASTHRTCSKCRGLGVTGPYFGPCVVCHGTGVVSEERGAPDGS